MKKKQLLERRAALTADIEARLGRCKAANESGSEIDFSAELGEVDKLNAELKGVQEQLAAAERIEEQIRARAAVGEGTQATGATVRSRILDQPWNGIGEFLLGVRDAETRLRSGQPIDERLASGFNEAVGSEGGFLVGTDMANTLIEQSYAQSPIASRCAPFNISSGSNGVKIPAVADKTRTDGNRWGGVIAYWAGEAAQYTATSPKPFEKIELALNKLTALTYATDELLEDAAAMQSWIQAALPAEIAFKIEDAIIRGNGAGTPLGILNSPALVSQAAEGSQTADTVNVHNVTKMYSRMPARLKPNAVWFIGSEVFPQLQLMTSAATSASQTVYMPPGGVSGAPYGTLFGRPIIEIEHASAIGDVGDVLFCDFSQYFLARKGGVKQQASIHVRFLFDETAFKFSVRIDGKPSWNTVITPYKGSLTQSPFVTLAAR